MTEAAVSTEPPTNLRAAYWIIAVHGGSSFCLGMVFPFTAIYLAGTPGVGTGGVALYFGLSGVANLAVALVLALGLIRPPRVALGVAGNTFSCAGYLVLATVDSLPLVAVAAAANGAGWGAFLAAIIPIVNSLVAPSDRRRIFARRYQVLNVTLATGSLVAGVLVAALSRDAIRYLILANAVGYVPIAATLLWHRRAARAGEAARLAATGGDGDSGSGGAAAGSGALRVSMPLLIKASLAACLFQFGAFLLGYSQFEVTMPLVADELMRLNLGWISVFIAVSALVILVAQDWMTRRLQPYPEALGLRAAVALWVGGYLLAAATAWAPTPVAVAGLIGYAVLFALGECAYSCSFHPWLISRVPEHALTRANALANSMMGIGLFAGPSLGVVLVGFGSAPVVWLVLAGLTATIGLTTVRVRQRITLTARPSGLEHVIKDGKG